MKKTKIRIVGLLLRVFCVLVCIYLFLNIIFFDNYSALSVVAQRNHLNDIVTNTESIENQNIYLEEQIERLRYDHHYIENIARQYYSMIRRGETVYTFRER